MKSIDIFPWNENFNTGIPKVDEQHRKLVQLLNVLASHVAFKSDIPSMNVIFDELADYAVYHFQTEEAIWHEYLPEDPLEAQHKSVHDSFIETVLRLKSEENTKSMDSVIEEVLAFLTRWLASHILESDRYLAMVVLAMQSGMLPEAAKKHAREEMSGATRVLIDIILANYEALSTNTLHLMRELAERKRDKEALTKLSLAVEQSPSSIVITDLDANIEYVNEAFCRITGFGSNEVLGKNPRLMQSGKTARKTFESMWAALAQGQVWRGEFINKRKDGAEYVESTLVTPVRQSDGTVTHYLAIKDDITERRHAESLLQESERRFRTVADAAPVLIWMAGTDKLCNWFNQSWLDFTGHTMEQELGNGWAEGVHPEDLQRCLDIYVGQFDRHEPFCMEYRLWRHDGTYRWIRDNGVPRFGANGIFEGYIGSCIDVTDQIVARDDAGKAKETLENVLSAATGISIIATDPNGLITTFNRGAEQMLGYTAEETIGKQIPSMIHVPSEVEQLGKELMLRTGRPVSGFEVFVAEANQSGQDTREWTYVRKDGSTLTVSLAFTTIRNQMGDITGYLGIAEDITARKHSEERIQALLREQEAMLETDLIGIVRVRNRVITWANSHYEKMLGYNKGELIQASTRKNYVSEEAYLALGSAAYPTLNAGHIYRTQIEHIRKDGRHIWVDLSGAMLDTDTGESLWTFVDITDRMRAEETLRKLSLAVEQSPSSIVITDLDANIEFVNEAFVKATGYSRAEVIGKNPRILQSGKTPKQTYVDMWATLTRGQAWKGEFIDKRKDGSEYTEQALITPVHQLDGKTTHYLAIKEDITERKALERHLADQLSFTQSIIDAEVDGISVCHAISEVPYVRFTVWNRSMEELTGYTMDEINHLGWYQTVYVDPEVQARAKQRMDRMRQGDHLRGEEWTITRKNGEQRVVQIYTTVCANDQEDAHVLAVMHEITKRKQAETALRESHQQMYSLLNSMAEGAYGVDTDGNCRFVNRSFLRILGYAHASDIIGKHIHELIHHTHADGRPYPATECRMYAAYRRNEEIHASDEVFWRKDGTPVPVEYWSQPIMTDGVVTGAIATFIDITERKKAEMVTQANAQYTRSLIEASLDPLVTISAQGKITDVNSATEHVTGMSRADLIGSDFADYFTNPEKARAGYRQVFSQGFVTDYPLVIRHVSGKMTEVLYNATVYRDDNGDVLGVFAAARDITERKKAELELRIAAIAFESQEGMLVTDADSVILRVNHAFTNITGYPVEEVIGRTPRLLHSGRHDANFYAAMWNSINQTGAWEGEIWNRRKNGEVYPEHLTITAVKDTEGAVTNYVATLTDITVSKAAADEIRSLAFYDPLTHLPNRRLLLDRLHQALAASARSGRQGALLFLDLDHFKTLNDTLGHDIGDLLLKQVAERLTSCVREGDTAARLGGDEFVVMLEDLSEGPFDAAAQAETIGNKILDILNRPYQLGAHECHSSTSIGATLFNDHQLGIEEILKQADIAMYQAKTSGRNALRFFDPQMQETVNARAALESELRKALENRQLQLYYQIQVDSSNRPLGAEALLRWPHPERNLMSPDQFIPLAEETGLILAMGQWVLETACAQLKAWQQDALTRDLTLSVNVSVKQFHKDDFVAQVQAALRRHAINPTLLKLELTESMLLENIEDTIAKMHALRQLGVRFSLDDFGTGYSSLQYLKQLPLDQLKIDKSFVHDLAVDSNDQAIVRTIIAMAQSLNLDVIAEGVETEDQRQLLLSRGCTHYQGYLFGKAVPLEAFELLVRQCS